MPRLPHPGSDAGNWGQILNDYLSVEHNANGTLKDVARPADLAAKYTKPASGISATDLHQSVQDTLATVGTHTTELSNHSTTLSQHTTDLAAKANQTDLSVTNTRIDGSLKPDGTLKDQSVTRAALGAEVAADVGRFGIGRLNLGAARMQPLPSPMATPPTISIGAVNGATAITNSVLLPWTDSRFQYLSGEPVVAGPNPPQSSYAEYHSTTAAIWPLIMNVEFELDSADFEILQRALSGNTFRIWVDGQPHQAAMQAGSASAGATLVRVQFSGRANRHIRIEGTAYEFGGVRIGPTDSLWRTSMPKGPRVMVLGDSFVGGVGGDGAFRGFAAIMGQRLGWRDIWPQSVGGTGYVNPGGNVTYRDRVQADIIARNPDVVVVQGSVNDLGYGGLSNAQIGAEAAALYAAIKAGVPKALLVVLLPFPMYATSAFDALRDAIKTAATGVADVIVDPIAEGWFSGTGKVGATTGIGNADRYRNADGVHPSTEGHAYIGMRLAAVISAYLGS